MEIHEISIANPQMLVDIVFPYISGQEVARFYGLRQQTEKEIFPLIYDSKYVLILIFLTFDSTQIVVFYSNFNV